MVSKRLLAEEPLASGLGFARSPVEFANSLLLLWWGMDALSEVLKALELDSAFFYNGEFSARGVFGSPNSCKLAPDINQSSGHVIVYQLADRKQGLWLAIRMAASRTSSVEDEWHEDEWHIELIVCH